MVQRKVPKKLGNSKLSFQLQDPKNRGSEMKKKMKKSRSVNLSDIHSLKSPSPSKKPVSQPGKPPPQEVMMTTTTPQKPALIRVTDGSPNYMKGTSSSEARRESLLLVSSRHAQANSDSKILLRRNQSGSKLGSVSGNKQTRSSSRTSSLKIARTLTKTPSFKKRSRIGLGTDVNAHRATFSSTLKDSKFPEYLMLNSGGTEAEGTSVLKVCPYTYCSLNRHLHKHFPPLKSFISARRRVLKTQRSMRMAASSPRKARPVDNLSSDIDKGELMIFDAETEDKELDFGKSLMSPIMLEKDMDGFVEIHVKNKKEGDETSTEKDHDGIKDFHGEPDQVAVSLSDEPPHSEIDSEENFGCYNDIFSIDIGGQETFPKEEQAEESAEDCPFLSPQAEAKATGFDNESNFEGECQTSVEEAFAVSEITNMEWEEARSRSFSSKADDEADYSEMSDVESDVDIVSQSQGNNNRGKTLLDDFSQDFLGRENAFDNTQLDNSDFEILEPSENFSQNFPSLSDDATREITAIEEEIQDAENSFTNLATTFVPKEDPIVESTVFAEDVQTNEAPEIDIQLGNLDDKWISEEMIDQAGVREISKAREDTTDHQDQAIKDQSPSYIDSEEQGSSEIHRFSVADNSSNTVEKMEDEGKSDSATTENLQAAADNTKETVVAFSRARKSPNQDHSDTCNTLKWVIRGKRPVEVTEDLRAFNPREPNYLPIVPEPDAEKVDLKHQEMDERKNAEEWMVDHALQRAVNKLAPARKRKVALLVEAFETVMPIPKCQTHVRQSSTVFAHGRPFQACN